jgi:hypothetical protein
MRLRLCRDHADRLKPASDTDDLLSQRFDRVNMSSSNSDRETLLSAALDGDLSVQEQSEFDRLIAKDPTFAEEFQELQTLREDLRFCFSDLRNRALPVAATNRILAAVAAEGERLLELKQNAPLLNTGSSRKIADQGTRPAKAKQIMAVLALAASVMIAFGIWNRVKTQTSKPDLVAQLPLEKPSSQSVASLPKVVGDTEPSVVQPEVSKVESIAIAAPAETESRPKVMGISPTTDRSIKADLVATAADDPLPKVESLMNVDAPVPAAERQPLSVVLVMAIELTASGRDGLALQEALRATDIRLDKDSVMGENVVSHLRSANVIDASVGAEGPATSKLYLVEASAKQLDRFITNMLSDSRSFQSVGLSLAFEPPLLAAVGDLREFNPINVRQDTPVGVARGLVAADGVSLSVDPAFSFAPLNRDDVAESGVMQLAMPAEMQVDSHGTSSSGEDFPAQLLLLVR